MRPWTLTVIHAFPLLAYFSGGFANQWPFSIPMPHQWHCSSFWREISFPFTFSAECFLPCSFASIFSCGVDGHMLHFSFFCSLAWNHCLFELWVDVSEKSFKISILQNSKTICSFTKNHLILQIHKKAFWFEARETLSPFLFLLETLSEKYIFHRQQPKYLLYTSFLLRLAGFQCSPRALRKFSFHSFGISDLACMIIGLENLKTFKIHQLKCIHAMVKGENTLCLKKSQIWTICLYRKLQSFSFPPGLPRGTQMTLHVIFSIVK